jgi:hypothetical protein
VNPEYLQTLLVLARQSWIEVEATIYAYDREYSRNARIGNALKLATVGSAVGTALSAAYPDAGWLTLGMALLTAGIAAYDQQYAPSKGAQLHWECRTSLDEIKRDISNYSVLLVEATTLAGGAEPFNQVGVRISKAKSVPVQLKITDRERAAQAFIGSFIHVLITRVNADITGAQLEETAELPSDAPDMIPAVRAAAV